MIDKIIWGCLIICCYLGCSGDYSEKGFIPTPKKIKSKKITVEASLRSNPAYSELILYLKVQNNSNKSIHVNYANCNLFIDAVRVALPVSKKTYKESLSPGEEENYEIVYSPINSMDFYIKANYPGDMKQKYMLKLDFISNNIGNPLMDRSFTFEMPDYEYKRYIQNYGRENKIQFFKYYFNKDTFITNQNKYLKEILSLNKNNRSSNTEKLLDNNILVSGTQIIIDNRLINLLCSRQSDTLQINVWLLNNGIEKIKVILNKFTINIAGHEYRPISAQSEFFNYNQIVDSAILLDQGARFVLSLKYCIPENYEQYELGSNWLLVQDNLSMKSDIKFQELLHSNLLFKRCSITALSE
jgi:hypothetical protein